MSEPRRIGVRGGGWRATVDGCGTIRPADGSPAIGWHVAGDERWYSPARETTTRQVWRGGTPVAETRMRVGGGDIVHRTWCVASSGGMTVIEFDNETAASVVVALTTPNLLMSRPGGGTTPAGIDLPAGSLAVPLGHRASVRLAVAHAAPAPGLLPPGIPGADEVVRGWTAACGAASQVTLPEPSLVEALVAARCEVLLGAGSGDSAPIEAVRLGETDLDALPRVVETAQRRVRLERRSPVLAWDTQHVLATAARACILLGDDTAAGDIAAAWLRLADTEVGPAPDHLPTGTGAVAWVESLLVRPSPSGGACDILPAGIPEQWWGHSFDCRGMTGDPRRAVSYAVRWHAERPALLWEVDGPPGLVLTGGGADAAWHSADPSGEALLAAPAVSGR